MKACNTCKHKDNCRYELATRVSQAVIKTILNMTDDVPVGRQLGKDCSYYGFNKEDIQHNG